MHSEGILPSEQKIALISTHNSITTKHYANGKHEPAGETGGPLAVDEVEFDQSKTEDMAQTVGTGVLDCPLM